MNSDPQRDEPGARAWLVSKSGLRAGTRYAVAEGATRVGRSADNTVVIEGTEAGIVSLHHFEIVSDPQGFSIRDLGSTNGTFVNGAAISTTRLTAPATIRLGGKGPEFTFIVEATPDLDKTIVAPIENEATPPPEPKGITTTYSGLLTEAVEKARRARARGLTNETMMIMRDTLQQALRRNNKRSRRIIIVLAVSLVALGSFTGWKIWDLRKQRHFVEARIQRIETELQKASGENAKIDQLMTQLDVYQGEAQQLERNLLYRLIGGKEDFVTREIRILMAEFGAEVYSIPSEFIDRVQFYLNQYQGPNRPIMAKALAEGERDLSTVRQIVIDEQLPPDLAYIPVVESAMAPSQSSAAGAVGLWQFTPPTARAYGLRVDKNVDERHDLKKATRAGCRYLRDLILDFGTGSSVMLALAAYNSGPAQVKAAVMKTVRDPIKQRNFWYLYRVRALPSETREYVPKVVAVMIIGRNPAHFGFAAPETVAKR